MSGADPVVALPRGVRLHHCDVRGVPVLLGPERALMLDEIGRAVLGEVDGASRLSAICARLAERYAAPLAEITGDVREFLDDLQRKRLIDYADG